MITSPLMEPLHHRALSKKFPETLQGLALTAVSGGAGTVMLIGDDALFARGQQGCSRLRAKG
jgi:hypothetical protein